MVKLLRTHQHLVVAFLLAALTVAVFRQTLWYDFTNYDDSRYVRDNPHVRAGLTSESVRWALTTDYESTWGPVVWLSYLADRAMFGMGPRGFHRTNVLLHVANVLLLFLVLRRMTGSVWRSGFVAALFAIHPLHVESVAWIAERKDVLSGLFWMLAMLAYVSYAERPSGKRYGLVALAFALGLMAKPMLVTLPLALLLLDYWPSGRFESARRKTGSGYRAWVDLTREKVPLLVLSAVFSFFAFVVQKKGGAVSSLSDISLGVRVANALVSYVKYIGKMVWPANLAAIYPHPGSALPSWQVVASGAALVIVSGFVLTAGRARKYLAMGWVWYLVTLLPVIGIVSIGAQAMADRYTYLPLIGLSIIVAWSIPDMLSIPREGVKSVAKGRADVEPGGRNRPTVPLAAAVAVLALTGLAYVQTGYWRNSVTLFEHALECTSNNYVAHNQLGAALHEQGDMEDAIKQYQEALRINPRYVGAQGNLGIALFEMGRARAAIPILSQVSRNYPQEVRTRINLGMALEQVGKTDEAFREYREAVRLAPDNMAARGSLGNALLKQGKPDDAIAQYLEMVRINPGESGAHHNLAIAFFDKRDYARAWQEVHLCEEYGGSPNPDFLDALSAKMPDPGR